MSDIPNKHDITELLMKLIPPILLATVSKLASEYRKGKRMSFLSMFVIACLAGCGAILGYWVSRYFGWTEYKMTLTIYFFGLFSDKLFEFLFSKTFLNTMFNFVQDWVVDTLKIAVNAATRKKE